jgi:hypothetical protein
MKALLLVVAALTLAGCGAERPAAPAKDAGPRLPPRSGPAERPPRLENGPPPAWIETERGAYWLSFSSYCWEAQRTALCADFIAPADRHDLPSMRVRRGEVVRFHLAFRPAEVSLQFFSKGGSPAGFSLEPRRVMSWTVERGGPMSLLARAPKAGDASYVAILVLRD